jgi:hypothetical protein
VDVLQHGLGFSRRQRAKVRFDDFSRPSDSRIPLGLFARHCHHRITASERPATPFRWCALSRNLLDDHRPEGCRAR